MAYLVWLNAFCLVYILIKGKVGHEGCLFETETIENAQHFVPCSKNIAASSCAKTGHPQHPWWKCNRISVIYSKTTLSGNVHYCRCATVLTVLQKSNQIYLEKPDIYPRIPTLPPNHGKRKTSCISCALLEEKILYCLGLRGWLGYTQLHLPPLPGWCFIPYVIYNNSKYILSA